MTKNVILSGSDLDWIASYLANVPVARIHTEPLVQFFARKLNEAAIAAPPVAEEPAADAAKAEGKAEPDERWQHMGE